MAAGPQSEQEGGRIGIIGGRYGSGITEAEHDRARERHIPCRIYFAISPVVDTGATDDEAAAVKLVAFRKKLEANHTVTKFSTPDNLAGQVATDLHKWLFDEYWPMQGVKREIPHPASDFVGREEEIEALCEALRRDKGAAIAAIHGMAGAFSTGLSDLGAAGLAGAYDHEQHPQSGHQT